MRLVAEKLAGERGGEAVFSGIDFTLSNGDCLIVTGENGSGKSTLLRIVAGLLRPASGEVRLESGGDEFPTVASAVHYLGHDNAMKPALTVAENLAFWRDFHGAPDMEVAHALERIGLPEVGHLPYGYLSTGQRRRVAVARLLVSARPIWLLDEPTAGLDARSERGFAEIVREHLEDGGIVVAATHVELGIEGARELRMGGGL